MRLTLHRSRSNARCCLLLQVSRDKSGEVTVQLTSLQLFARDVYRLLSMSEGRLALGSFEAMYLRTLGTAVQPTQYGYQSVVALLQAIPHTVLIRGKGNKQILTFNKEIQCKLQISNVVWCYY